MEYFLLYKPFGMLSQFLQPANPTSHQTLSDLAYCFPKDVYPIGRLDADSEGLLLLTNDKQLNHRLLNPQYQHQRTYCVQVEGLPQLEAIQQLEVGVVIKIDGKPYKTRPAKVLFLNIPPLLPPRTPPVRYRATIPDSWLSITLTEGKNRQVRRMTAAVGLPTLRLVRVAIGQLHLFSADSIPILNVGECIALKRNEVYGHIFT